MLALHRVLAALALCFLLTGSFAGSAAHRARPAPSPEDLYSRRALRRARLVIELRLLQFRLERLECIRRAILANLPPDLRPRARKGTSVVPPETCANLFP